MNIQKLKSILLFLALIITDGQTYAQSMDSLNKSINEVTKSKKAFVGVAISGINPADTLSINGAKTFPMQSVFKLPISLAMLAEIDKGKYSFDEIIDISKDELLPGLWSPIREKYPDGAKLTISEIIQYTVSLSDNVGCDVLLKLLGGPHHVEQYFSQLGFKEIAIKINEETMQSNWDLQFKNWITPKEANNILKVFYNNTDDILSQKSHDFIWETMKSTQTGENRLKGQLPKNVVVAHKTGWSGVHPLTGISAAVNDMGLIFLPNGDFFIISLFITNSCESTDENEKIIAEIAKLAWDYFNSKS